MVQCVLEEDVHTAASIDQDTVDLVVGYLDRHHHWVIVGHDGVVDVILHKDDLAACRLARIPLGHPVHLFSFCEYGHLPCIVFSFGVVRGSRNSQAFANGVDCLNLLHEVLHLVIFYLFLLYESPLYLIAGFDIIPDLL